MSATAIVALTPTDFEGLEIGTNMVGWVHGEVAAGRGGWLIHGEPRYLRVLAAALAEAAQKAEAAAQLLPAVAS